MAMEQRAGGGGLKIQERTILALVKELAGPATILDQGTIGGLLLELQRRRQADEKAEAGKPTTLEAAAEVLLSVLDLPHQDHLKDVAYEMPLPKWVLMLGAVAKACDQRELRNGIFQPMWLNSPEAVLPVKATPKCERCGLEIPGGRRGQRFCCSRHGSDQDTHSDDCVLVPKPEPATVEP
jgi:hypothetical protein